MGRNSASERALMDMLFTLIRHYKKEVGGYIHIYVFKHIYIPQVYNHYISFEFSGQVFRNVRVKSRVHTLDSFCGFFGKRWSADRRRSVILLINTIIIHL